MTQTSPPGMKKKVRGPTLSDVKTPEAASLVPCEAVVKAGRQAGQSRGNCNEGSRESGHRRKDTAFQEVLLGTGS